MEYFAILASAFEIYQRLFLHFAYLQLQCLHVIGEWCFWNGIFKQLLSYE